jgi:pimeloyl-ACP methyl ester carboxylesterase
MIAKYLLVAIGCMLVVGSIGDLMGPREEIMAPENSIYRSESAETRLMQIYDERLAEWPIPYEELNLETSYGTVHVIASGPVDAEPVLLLHASELSATSWARNIAIFANYRTYAIDHIGEVNKSRLSNVEIYPKTREELAALYAEIADLLGVERSMIVGASNGGFLAMNYAIQYPERATRLILAGPMGLTPPPLQMGLRLVAAQFIHLPSIEQATLKWVLGSSPVVLEPYGEWFVTLMRGAFPCVVPPVGIPSDELAQIQVPVLLILGSHDNVVGNADRAAAAARVMPNVQIEVLDSAHLVNWEKSDDVNESIARFLE